MKESCIIVPKYISSLNCLQFEFSYLFQPAKMQLRKEYEGVYEYSVNFKLDFKLIKTN